MRRLLLVACQLAMIVLAAAQTLSQAHAQTVSHTPTVTAVLDGDRKAVFTTPGDSCSGNDIPDAMARAFRDDAGAIHFVSSSSTMYQSIGSSLDNLRHSCKPAFTSSGDPNPADFNDQVWLDSFFTFDGKKVAALGHTEYHGWSHPGECHNSQNLAACEYDADTYHLSTDGGYHFHSFKKAPLNYLAGFPYKYQVDNGPMGYSVDSNVIEYGGLYYAIATDWSWPPNCSGQTGPQRCRVPLGGAPIRTADVFDPTSWRGWNGSDFTLSFANPYPGPVAHPEEHVYTPVPYMQFVNGLNVDKSANVAVATLWDYWDNELGPPGLYLTTSKDMINWTKPKLVVTLKQILANDPKGSWLYAYFSLVDPDAPDPNFSIIGDHPYLYYVRLDNNSSARVLFRQRLSLTVNP